MFRRIRVNNLPRTFMDVAQVTVTRDRAGVFHVNLYQDAAVTLDGVTFAIEGNYPVGSVVTVRVSDPAAKVVFRTPAWCPKLDVAQPEKGVWRLTFDMNPRLLDGPDTAVAKKEGWHYARYLCREQPLRSPLRDSYRAAALNIAYMGRLHQGFAGHSGDHIAIDWGYAYLAGEIDHDAAQSLRMQLDDALVSRSPQTLIIDLGGVGFMDSSGVGLILGRQRCARVLGTSLRLQHAPAQLQKVLRLAGIPCTENIEKENAQ